MNMKIDMREMLALIGELTVENRVLQQLVSKLEGQLKAAEERVQKTA